MSSADNEKSPCSLPTNNWHSGLSVNFPAPAKRALSSACNHTEAISFLIGNGDADRTESHHTWASRHSRGQKGLPDWFSCHLLGCCISRENGACAVPVSSGWRVSVPAFLERIMARVCREEGGRLSPETFTTELHGWISTSQIYSVSWVERLS